MTTRTREIDPELRWLVELAKAAHPTDAKGRELTELGAVRRAEILAQAASLFAEQGYDYTSISAIARAAGIAKGLLYFYFSSKEDLLQELATLLHSCQRAQIRAVQEDLEPTLDKLYAGILVTSQFFADHYNIAGISASVAATTPTPYHQMIRSHARMTSKLVDQGQREGSIRDNESAENMAFAIGSLVTELVHYQVRGVLRLDAVDVGALAARSSMYMVATDPSLVADIVARHEIFANRAREARRRA